MLKVACESCQAPYQVDERRVPATGLKMRCPKCGHSFVVHNPNAPAVAPRPPQALAAPSAPPPTPAAASRPPSAKKPTMVGMGLTGPAAAPAPGPIPVDDPFAGIAP